MITGLRTGDKERFGLGHKSGFKIGIKIGYRLRYSVQKIPNIRITQPKSK